MNKLLVYITREIPKKGLDILNAECEVVVNHNDSSLSKKELIVNFQGAQGLISMLSDPIDKEVIKSNKDLKIIANYAVGYNNIDIKAATEQGVAVTNTPGVLTETTADLGWTLLMAVARRIVNADKYTRSGLFKGWAPKLLLGMDVYKKTLGIIGLGRIGKAITRRAEGFNMRVLYNKRNRLSSLEEERLGVEYRKFDALLPEADFIIICAPLTDDTYHLFSKKEFSLMKPSAIIINIGRGPIINEEDLAMALKNGQIAGAGLDVYEKEPEIQSDLLTLDNVILIPHIGSATIETRDEMAVMVAKDILAGLKDKKIDHLVNPEIFA